MAGAAQEQNQLEELTPHRYLTEDEWRHFVVKRLTESRHRMDEMTGLLEANTKVTKEVAESTKGVVEMFQAVSGAFKVLDMLSKLAKPLAVISGLIAFTSLAYVEMKRRLF